MLATIIVVCLGLAVSTKVKTADGQIAWNQFQVNLGGQNYQLNYTMSGNATLNSIIADGSRKALSFVIDSRSDGQLMVELPRQIMDSLEAEAVDRSYYVYITSAENGNAEEAKPATELYGSSHDTRILLISFPGTTTQIDIVGTYLLPEFANTLICVIILSSVLSIIVFGTRLGHRTVFGHCN